MVEETKARYWLQAEFARKRAKNPRYSLRMLAERLNVPSGRLSEILSGKRLLTVRLAEKIAERLALPPDKKNLFLDCVSKERSVKPKVDDKTNFIENYKQVSADSFYVISDWFHFAILSLIETKNFDSNPKCIAERLGISPIQVKSALERLQRLDLIKVTKKGYACTHAHLTTTHDISSAAIRASHKQSLERAIETLEVVDVDDRDVTSITMAIDRSKIPLAKTLIKDFRRKLCRVLETGEREEVYSLNVQLIPLTRIKKGNHK